MDVELRRDLGDSQPSRAAEVLARTLDTVSSAEIADGQAPERLAGAGTQPARVERPSDLLVGLLSGQRADLLDDRCRGPSQVRGAERQRLFDGGGRTAFPAQLDADRAVAHQRDVFDQQTQHALALPG